MLGRRSRPILTWLAAVAPCWASFWAPWLVATPLLAADWPQFRGPARNGISAETAIATNWPATGPRELWRVPIGSGFSGVAVVGERVYTLDAQADGEYAVCLAAATGKELWRTRIGNVFANSFGNGPTATPTLDAGWLYALSGEGNLVALNAQSGEVRFRLDLKTAWGSELPQWGFASAPLVVGERLLLETGASNDKSIVALHKETGTLLWSRESSAAAYNSPQLLEFGGQKRLIFLNSDNLVGLSLDGQVLFTHPFAKGNGIKPAAPIFVPPDVLVLSASYDIGALAVRLKPGENGAIGVEEVPR